MSTAEIAVEAIPSRPTLRTLRTIASQAARGSSTAFCITSGASISSIRPFACGAA
jgi:hypothetical protein